MRSISFAHVLRAIFLIAMTLDLILIRYLHNKICVSTFHLLLRVQLTFVEKENVQRI